MSTRTLLVLMIALVGVLLPVAYMLFLGGAAPKGTIERVEVYGRSLEGNLAGDSPTREASVYLPPSYVTDQNRRFPVLYVLHGLLDTNDRWFGAESHFINLPKAVDRAVDSGGPEMIVVMPDAHTKLGGSMFSRSATTGDWETFVATELVRHVDGRYRTLATAASRGLAGHSMGGYGVLRLGMKYPDVFSALYAQSPCCIDIDASKVSAGADSITTFEELEKADFDVRAQFAWAAAWSPNPQKPPFFLDLPFERGEFRPAVAMQWEANSPLQMVGDHIGSLRRVKALAFDVGDEDALVTGVRALDGVMNRHALPHIAEIYPGDHFNRIDERFEKQVLPFFYRHLEFE